MPSSQPRTRTDRRATGPVPGTQAGDLDSHAVLDSYNQGLSIRQIAVQTGRPRARVTDMLRRAGATIAPRGTGRPRPAARITPPADVHAVLEQLYLTQRRTRAQIATELGVPEHRVGTWLRDCGIQPRTRGRQNREDRNRPTKPDLQDLYTRQLLPAREVGSRLSSSIARVLSGLHEDGIPVRAGGNATPDSAICLLDALYSDPAVQDALARHHVPIVPRPGPLAHRFPTPHQLTKALLADLYTECGLTTIHVELLTGQPSSTIRRTMINAGIPLRSAGGRSPFVHRLRGRSSD